MIDNSRKTMEKGGVMDHITGKIIYKIRKRGLHETCLIHTLLIDLTRSIRIHKWVVFTHMQSCEIFLMYL